MGSCPEYVVRIAENGDVRWKGLSLVERVGNRQSNIGRESAHALLKQFGDGEWPVRGVSDLTS